MARKQSRWLAWVFVGPSLFLVVVFLVYPTIQTVYYSLTKGTMLNPGSEFVGLGIFNDCLRPIERFYAWASGHQAVSW